MWDFYQTREVKRVRKPCRCDECGGFIEAGESCRRWAGRFEGEFMGGAVHGDCQDWANRILLDTGDGRPLLSDASLDEDVDIDALKANPPPATVRSRLSHRWRALIAEAGQP